jgi:hypothetical protein
MVARGYGAGTMTRLPEPAYTGGERLGLAVGSVGCVVGLALIAGLVPYAIYPLADPLLSTTGLVVAGGVLLLSLVGAGALRTRA